MPLETQRSRKLRENRHPNRGNWQRNCRKGSRIGSALTRPDGAQAQIHRKPGFTGSAPHGDTWFKNKTCPCMSGGGSAPCFPSYGCMNSKVRLMLSIPRSTLHHSALKNVKISTPAKGEPTHACWCDLEEPQGETKMCTPSSSHPHVTWLALLSNLTQQDSKFRFLLLKSRSLHRDQAPKTHHNAKKTILSGLRNTKCSCEYLLNSGLSPGIQETSPVGRNRAVTQ